MRSAPPGRLPPFAARYTDSSRSFRMCSRVRLAQKVERHAIAGVRADQDSYRACSESAGGSLYSLSVMGYGASSASIAPTVGNADTTSRN